MSGITGVFVGEASAELAHNILDNMKHRGPKAKYIYNTGNFAIGHNLCFEDGNYKQGGSVYAVVDGFISNENVIGITAYEKVINMYQEYGDSFPEYCYGTFSFILVDKEKIIAARDSIGLKPLYYVSRNKEITFLSSEIKGLLGVARDVKEFPPGCYYHSEKGFINYYDEPDIEGKAIDENEAIKMTNELLTKSTERCISENQKMGIFLSGGLDSSIIASAASKLSNQINTFSVGAKNSEDLNNARLVADHLGANHYEHILTSEEMLNTVPKVIYHLESFDSEIVRSSIANYLLAKMAKKNGVDISITGEGSDELFAGYNYLKDYSDKGLRKELNKLLMAGHNGAFQRVDRMNMAHSVIGRMPFMDKDVINFAYNLPSEWKLKNDGNKLIEKWILRKAFEKELPKEVVWRKKEQFSSGAGCIDMLSQISEEKISNDEFERERKIEEDFIIKSKEELYYYRIFKEFFPQFSILDTIGRTAESLSLK